MEIRVLGPVEVLVDGTPRTVPGTGERELLALLALSAGRVVASSTLIDALWGEDLPANPDNALQVRVSKLRRALAALGLPPEVITTRRPGYLLDLDSGQVDALRFAERVALARASGRHRSGRRRGRLPGGPDPVARAAVGGVPGRRLGRPARPPG